MEREANAVQLTSEQVVGIALGSFRPEVAQRYFQAQKLPVVKVKRPFRCTLANATGSGRSLFLFCRLQYALPPSASAAELLEKLIAVRSGEAPGLLTNTQMSLVDHGGGESAALRSGR